MPKVTFEWEDENASFLVAITPYVDSEYGSREHTTRELADGEFPIVQAITPCTIETPGYYLLMEDIEVAVSGIAILSNDVTLDLNGYTITYGTGCKTWNAGVITYNGLQSGNCGHSAIASPWDPRECKDFEFPWYGHWTGFTLKNGTITAGKGAELKYSPAVNVGACQGEVHDLVINQSRHSSSCIIIGKETHAHHNTCNHSTREVHNRHALFHSMAAFQNSDTSEIHSTFERNWIVGSPQCGIRLNDEIDVFRNKIELDTTVANGYAIHTNLRNNCYIGANVIDNVNGRGIHVSGIGHEVTENDITTTEEGNDEYPKVDVHGIKLEHEGRNPTQDCEITGNTVRCIAGEGGTPTPLSLELENGDNGNVIYDNTFIAEGEGSVGCWITGAEKADGSGLTITGNRFESDDWMVEIDLGGNSYTFKECTFVGTSPTAKFAKMNSWGPDNTYHFKCVDCVFEDVDFRTAVWPNNIKIRSVRTYDIKWTLTITGQPGTAGKIASAFESLTYFTIGPDGTTTLELLQYSVLWNWTKTNSAVEYEYSPYTLHYDTFTQRINLTRPMTVDLEGDSE